MESLLDRFSPLELKLLNLLETEGPFSCPDIAKRLGYPRITCHDNLSRLVDQDLVKKFSRNCNARGRPPMFFKRTEVEI